MPECNTAKVAYVIWSLEPGGAERIVMNLAKLADRTSITPAVICLNQKGALAEELEGRGIRVTALGKKPGFDPAIILGLSREVRRMGPDILSTHLWTSNFWGRIAGLLCRVPVIVATEHNLPHSRRFHHYLADYLLAALTNRVIAVSESVEKAFRRKLPGLGRKIVVIRNGIPVEEFEDASGTSIKGELGLGESEPIVATIGRLVEQKGVTYLIQAAPEILNHYPAARFVVAGDGPLRPALEKEAKALGVVSSFLFLGTRKDVPDILGSTDIVAVPSLYEGLPLSVLEAMAAGKPIAATRVPGITEVVEDGREALLVPPGQPEALAEAIVRLLGDAALGRLLAKNARERVRREFAVERMVSETESLYLRLIEGKRRRHDK